MSSGISNSSANVTATSISDASKIIRLCHFIMIGDCKWMKHFNSYLCGSN
jgi:hypothetical protein